MTYFGAYKIYLYVGKPETILINPKCITIITKHLNFKMCIDKISKGNMLRLLLINS